MGSYFLDTSAIVKRYFPEQGHTWIVTLCDPEQAHRLYISQAALVEVVATVCRKAREQSIADEERDAFRSAPSTPKRHYFFTCEEHLILAPATALSGSPAAWSGLDRRYAAGGVLPPFCRSRRSVGQ